MDHVDVLIVTALKEERDAGWSAARNASAGSVRGRGSASR